MVYQQAAGTRESHSRVPASSVPLTATNYGRGGGVVGRGLGVGVGLTCGVALGVGVGLGVGFGVGLGVGVGVGIGACTSNAPMSDPSPPSAFAIFGLSTGRVRPR